MRERASKSLSEIISCGSVGVLAVVVALATTAPAVASQSIYTAQLSGSSEVPPTASTGTGFVAITIDFALVTMRVQASFTSLESLDIAAHVHCCAPAGTNVAVAALFPGFPLGATSGTYDNTIDMTLASSYNAAFIASSGGTVSQAFNALVAGMNAGDSYVDIHTSVFPGGEIRGALVAAPAFQSALSRRVHGAAGTFDLPLASVVTNPTTEPRQGPAQTIVFTFDKPISSATATITEGIATAGAATFSGNDVIVGLTGVTDKQYVTIALGNVASVDGGTGGSGAVRVGFLLGDVNQNRVVLLSDLVLVNAQLAKLVTSANFLKDVNANGTLTLGDIIFVNANLAKALPAP